MKRITSIKNAIKYFENGTKTETRKTATGQEYKIHIPPSGFHKLTATYTNGITAVYGSWNWCDYVRILRGESLCTDGVLYKICLYYN